MQKNLPESTVDYVDELGFPTCKTAIAQQFWLGMTPGMRMEIGKKVPGPELKKLTMRAINKRDLEHLRACHRFVAEHLLDFHVNGNVLTASLKDPLPPI